MVNWDKIERLSSMSLYKPNFDRLLYIDKNWNEFTELEYQEIIEKLYLDLLDPITMGFNYNQTDIKHHLKKLK